jgi:hypothetical protein
VVLYTYVFWVPLSLVPALFVWAGAAGIAWLWLLDRRARHRRPAAVDARAEAGRSLALTPISFLQLPLVTPPAGCCSTKAPSLAHRRRRDFRRQRLHRPPRSGGAAPQGEIAASRSGHE